MRFVTRSLVAAVVLLALAIVPIALGHSHPSADGDRIAPPVPDASGSAPRCTLCRLTSQAIDAPLAPPAPCTTLVSTASDPAPLAPALDAHAPSSTPRAPPASL